KNKEAGFSKRADAWLAAAKRGLPAKTAVGEIAAFLEELRVGKTTYDDVTRRAMATALTALSVYGKEAEPAVAIVGEYYAGRWPYNSTPSEADTAVNHAAAQALGKIGSPKCLPTLFKVLAENKSDNVRYSGVETLGTLATMPDFPNVKEVVARLQV